MASLTTADHTDRELKYIKEAEQHLKEAKARLKTSFTKWKADYLMAGPAFAKAGNSYRLGKEPKLAVDAYLHAATCGEKAGQIYETGKYRDLAAQILSKSKDQNDRVQAADLYAETMTIFMGMEDFMGGAAACKKAVAIWSKIDPAKAVTMNREMIDQLESVDRGTYALEMYRETITLACKCERWAMAQNMIKKAIVGFIEAGRPPRSVHGWHLSEIILLAKIGDVVALDETFLESLSTQGYAQSDECEVAEEINRGMKDRDHERLSKAMELRGMKNSLLPVIVNLAKSMWPKLAVEDDEENTKQKQKQKQKQQQQRQQQRQQQQQQQQQEQQRQQQQKKQAQQNQATAATAASASSGEMKETKETKDPAVPAASADGLDSMDDLMEGLEDLVEGLPEANEDDDDLL